jgi:integrase
MLVEEKVHVTHFACVPSREECYSPLVLLAIQMESKQCEIKQLRWQDIDLLNRVIIVRASKTEAGQRLIPMNKEANEVMLRLRERAKPFNGIEKHHYIFPACEDGHVDPARHQKKF